MKPVSTSAYAARAGVIAFYVLFASYIWRSLAYIYQDQPESFYWYAGLELVFLALFAIVMLRPNLPVMILVIYFAVQCTIIFYLSLTHPQLDYLTGFYILLSYQVALIMTDRIRWVWWGIFIGLILVSLIISHGWVMGIALALSPIVGCIIFPVYVIANRQEENDNRASERLLGELQEKHTALQDYASQAEQIATIEERNRLARELHDSVSQTIFSIVLNTRAAQILLERQPDRMHAQLDKLQNLTQVALAEMRSLISQLRTD